MHEVLAGQCVVVNSGQVTHGVALENLAAGRVVTRLDIAAGFARFVGVVVQHHAGPPHRVEPANGDGIFSVDALAPMPRRQAQF